MIVEKQGIRRIILTLPILSVLAIFLMSAGLLCRPLYEHRKGERGCGELRQHMIKASGQEPDPQPPGSLPIGGQEPMLAIDFEALKKLSPHIVAWIHIPGTPVSYPVTQGEDSSYYLTRTLSGAYNEAGRIPMDYRSSLPPEGGNMVLYGHNTKNGSMFSSLKRYQDNEHYEEHASFHLYTAEGDNFPCHITDRRRIPVQTDFFSDMRDKKEEIGESDKADESGKAGRDAGVTLVTCVAERDKGRLTIRADAKRTE